IPSLNILLQWLLARWIKYSKNQHIVNSIHMGWFLLQKYYILSNAVPVYATALLLHLSRQRNILIPTGQNATE
ncbi:hypothetical protein K469DRAFT_581869, partial [Zopfia rhizophila CBS 207.26]